ncbi:MAG: peptidylprolyl isomerase, partial [Candidatus Fonsibacter sp.]
MKLTFIFSLLLINWFSVYGQHDKVLVDKIVAQIGDNIILLSDIEAQKQQAIASGIKENTADCSVLEQLMFQEL